jgi:hypothetical protein
MLTPRTTSIAMALPARTPTSVKRARWTLPPTAARALNVLLKVASAATLVSVGCVAPLPSLFGGWQEAAEHAASLALVLGAIQAIQLIQEAHDVPVQRRFCPRVHHRRCQDAQAGGSTRLAG